MRTPYWLSDSTVSLHALASLIEQAHNMLPDARRRSPRPRQQVGEIGHLLGLAQTAAARRYRGHP